MYRGAIPRATMPISTVRLPSSVPQGRDKFMSSLTLKTCQDGPPRLTRQHLWNGCFDQGVSPGLQRLQMATRDLRGNFVLTYSLAATTV